MWNLLNTCLYLDEAVCFLVRLSFSVCTEVLTGSVHGPSQQPPNLRIKNQTIMDIVKLQEISFNIKFIYILKDRIRKAYSAWIVQSAANIFLTQESLQNRIKTVIAHIFWVLMPLLIIIYHISFVTSDILTSVYNFSVLMDIKTHFPTITPPPISY